MRCNTPGATKILVVHEQPAKAEQLVAWTVEWGYAPFLVETPAQAIEEITRLEEPWLGIFSLSAWSEIGHRVVTLSEALPGTAPGFYLVAAEPGAIRPPSFSGDFVCSEVQPQELQSRLNLANLVVGLQLTRNLLVEQLEKARGQLRKLEGMLPICMDCKKIRDERNRWQPIEHYISARSHAAFTHGLCPSCFQKRIEELRPVG